MKWLKGTDAVTLNDLASLAASKKMIPNAPVRAERSIEIEAPAIEVWTTLADVARWPKWHQYLRNAKLHGPFEAGTRLTYGGLFKHHLRLALVEAPRLVMIHGTLMGYTAITRWDVEQLGPARTRVTFSESSDGLLIGSLYGNDKLATHLQNWLDRLKEELERKGQ